MCISISLADRVHQERDDGRRQQREEEVDPGQHHPLGLTGKKQIKNHHFF